MGGLVAVAGGVSCGGEELVDFRLQLDHAEFATYGDIIESSEFIVALLEFTGTAQEGFFCLPSFTDVADGDEVDLAILVMEVVEEHFGGEDRAIFFPVPDESGSGLALIDHLPCIFLLLGELEESPLEEFVSGVAVELDGGVIGVD